MENADLKPLSPSLTYSTEVLKFRRGSLGGLASQHVQFKASSPDAGSPYVNVESWDEEAVKNVVQLIAAAPQLIVALNDLLANAEAKETYIRMLEGTATGDETPAELDSPEMKRARALLDSLVIAK